MVIAAGSHWLAASLPPAPTATKVRVTDGCQEPDKTRTDGVTPAMGWQPRMGVCSSTQLAACGRPWKPGVGPRRMRVQPPLDAFTRDQCPLHPRPVVVHTADLTHPPSSKGTPAAVDLVPVGAEVAVERQSRAAGRQIPDGAPGSPPDTREAR